MIRLSNLTLQRGPQRLLEGAEMTLHAGHKAGLIGANGAGKSSLFALLRGELSPDAGDCQLPGDWRIAHMRQEVDTLDRLAVDYVLDGDVRLRKVQAELAAAEHAHDGTALARLHSELESADGYTADARARKLLAGLGFTNEQMDRRVGDFSGGWRMRLNLAQALMCPSDLLLLDEPTNHLDAESVAWLERTLKDYHGTVVAITHDRYFLDNVAGWILEMDHGRGIPFEGNYSGWLEQKAARLEAEQKTDSARRRTLERELEWVRMAPRARQSKGRARLTAYDRLVAEAADVKRRDRELQIDIPANQRLGDQVVEVEHLAKGFGDKLLIEDLSFSLPPAGIVGVIGGNGAGKTTLFRLLVESAEGTGESTWTPDAGAIRIGPTVEIGYVDQSRDTLDPERTVYEEITEGREFLQVGRREVNGRAYVASFNFKGTDQQKKVGDLSGGERNRVHLAKVLKSGANLLLLDEPTNDLDVDTLRALESGLDAYAGCAVIISHDRWFLDRVATHVLAFEGDSQVRWFEGNFTEYEAYRKKELGLDAQPTRVRYKPLTRT